MIVSYVVPVNVGVERLLVARHQVLGGVEGVLGDELGVVGAEEVGVLVLQHVRARGLGHDESTCPGPHRGGQHRHVALGVLLELLRVPGVEPRHATTHLTLGELAAHAVVFEYPHEVTADLRILILDETRGEQRDRAVNARRRAARVETTS